MLHRPLINRYKCFIYYIKNVLCSVLEFLISFKFHVLILILERVIKPVYVYPAIKISSERREHNFATSSKKMKETKSEKPEKSTEKLVDGDEEGQGKLYSPEFAVKINTRQQQDAHVCTSYLKFELNFKNINKRTNIGFIVNQIYLKLFLSWNIFSCVLLLHVWLHKSSVIVILHRIEYTVSIVGC